MRSQINMEMGRRATKLAPLDKAMKIGQATGSGSMSAGSGIIKDAKKAKMMFGR